jgi:hypothetical protein
MIKYRVKCYIHGMSETKIIEAREMTVNEGAYMFWKGEYGQTNELVASYPVAFTIIKNLKDEE